MPEVRVVIYQEEEGNVPFLGWLRQMERRDADIVAKCRARLDLLAEQGHALRRPIADYLRDDIYELRVRVGSSNYRILYFFHGRMAAVLSHGLMKEDVVPSKEINLAIQRRDKFILNPRAHTYEEEAGDEHEA